jgi:hypothetical protein
MKNRIIKCVMVLAAGFLAPQIAQAQGFVNLDFENADLSAYGAGSVSVANAIPGWSSTSDCPVFTPHRLEMQLEKHSVFVGDEVTSL